MPPKLDRTQLQAGEEVVVTEQNEPVARIVPAALSKRRPCFGAARGLLTVRDDFDEPLDDFAPFTE